MESHTRRPWVTRAYGRQPRTPCKNRKEYGGLAVNVAVFVIMLCFNIFGDLRAAIALFGT
jgi:hypothetical protein